MRTVTAAIIRKEDSVLIARRKKSDSNPLKWEFPGGKMEENETARECLAREIKEELNIDVDVTGLFMKNIYHYPSGSIELDTFFAEIIGGTLALNAHSEVKWVQINQLKKYDFCDADVEVVRQLLRKVN